VRGLHRPAPGSVLGRLIAYIIHSDFDLGAFGLCLRLRLRPPPPGAPPAQAPASPCEIAAWTNNRAQGRSSLLRAAAADSAWLQRQDSDASKPGPSSPSCSTTPCLVPYRASTSANELISSTNVLRPITTNRKQNTHQHTRSYEARYHPPACGTHIPRYLRNRPFGWSECILIQTLLLGGLAECSKVLLVLLTLARASAQ
jgi:ABC-type nickel/cobalt efflux system permease component RcnA